jgi:hypothetical protein
MLLRKDVVMTNLPLSLVAAMLSVAFAPTAGAYGTEPASQSFVRLSPIAMSMPQTAKIADACVVNVTPAFAAILGLPSDWRDNDTQRRQASLACAEQ